MEQRERANNFEESLRIAVEGRISNVWTAIPGVITAVNLAKMTVQVQPTVKARVRLQDPPSASQPYTWVALPVLLDVPIVFPCAGGFALTLPITVGDEVLVIFSSRCIDSWWQSGGVQIQAEVRMHSLSDGFAIPGPKSLPNVLAAISTNSAQLRTQDGSAYIELTAAGAVNVKAPGGLNVTGAIVATGDVQGNGHNLSTHIHGGVTTGGGDTGTPIG